MKTKLHNKYDLIEKIGTLAEQACVKVFIIDRDDFGENETGEIFTETQINKLLDYSFDYICEEWCSIKDDSIQKLKAKEIK